MQKLRIICLGKTGESYIKEGISLFLNKIKPFTSVEWLEIPLKSKPTDSVGQYTLAEAVLLEKHLDKNDYIILLDEKGRSYTSRQVENWFSRLSVQGHSQLVFIIGGAYGFHSTIYQRASTKWSLSMLTFPHELVRLILLEQLYRTCTIERNLPYHHD